MGREVVVDKLGRGECPGKLCKRNNWKEQPFPTPLPHHTYWPTDAIGFQCLLGGDASFLYICVQNYAKPTLIPLFPLVALPGIFKALL